MDGCTLSGARCRWFRGVRVGWIGCALTEQLPRDLGRSVSVCSPAHEPGRRELA